MTSIPAKDVPVRRNPSFPGRITDSHLSNSETWPVAGGTVSPERVEPGASTFLARILVVDDDADIRNFVAQILCGVGHRVGFAEDGEAGWEALRAGDFDVLITDHDMPRLSGLDLVRRVRSVPVDLPVILMSGRLPQEGADFLRLHPPGQTMAKPFSLLELLDKVQCLLAQVAILGAVSFRYATG
jgi:CheY-like chemotaxis protein